MDLEILISTIRMKDEIENDMNIRGNFLVINQTKDMENIVIKNEKGRVINTNTIGLSVSRNIALKSAIGEICLIADDDMKYVENVEEIIIKEFKNNPKEDILIFVVEKPDGSFLKFNNQKKIGFINSMKCSSVQIAFRRERILNKNIKFNEKIGSGSRFFLGEESEFLFQCLRKKMKIRFVNKKIGKLRESESTWFKGFNKEYFISRGAAFEAMNSYVSVVLILQFAIRKKKLYENEMGIVEAMKYMMQGRKAYRRE